ncbi:unnamed protein product [Amoebophrya sp. A25]|nr:unnamed protein product [Amoebophrya sp. A25]|eukprot:GSA25T00002328001.1
MFAVAGRNAVRRAWTATTGGASSFGSAVGSGGASSSSSSSTGSRTQEIIGHAGVRLVAFGWGFFIAENLILSENRTRIINRIGDAGYHFLYNTCSTLSLGCIAWGYLNHGRRQGPLLWKVTPGMRGASIGFSLLGALGFAQLLPTLRSPASFVSALSDASASRKNLCPMDFEAERRSSTITTPHGIKRITRHGSLWSFAALSVGCALRTPFATEVALFLGPVPTVLCLGWHMDSRFRRQMGGDILEHHGADWPFTSHLPFGALIGGAQEWAPLLEEWKKTNAAVAATSVALYALAHFRK